MGMSNAAIDFIAANPRSTAKEAGLTNAEANALVGQGKIVAVGNRVTGKRGRPPMEYVVAGAALDDDAMIQAQVAEAQERVRRHKRYEQLWARVLIAYREYGYGSEEHTAAKADLHEVFPPGQHPVTPSKNDYVLAGEVTVLDVDTSDMDVPELVEA